jgi:hypothetical protein
MSMEYDTRQTDPNYCIRYHFRAVEANNARHSVVDTAYAYPYCVAAG